MYSKLKLPAADEEPSQVWSLVFAFICLNLNHTVSLENTLYDIFALAKTTPANKPAKPKYIHKFIQLFKLPKDKKTYNIMMIIAYVIYDADL